MSWRSEPQPISLEDPRRASEHATYTQLGFYLGLLPAVAFAARQILNIDAPPELMHNSPNNGFDLESITNGIKLFASGALMFGAGEMVAMTRIEIKRQITDTFKFALITAASAALATGAALVSKDVPIPFMSPEMIAFTMHGVGELDKRWDNLLLGIGFAAVKKGVAIAVGTGKFINSFRN